MSAPPSAGPRCRFCGATRPAPFADLGRTPVANALRTPAERARAEPFFPLRAFVCCACLLVQLEDFHAADELFAEDYVYFSSYSDSWLRHAEAYVETVASRFVIGPGRRVVEVASNDGYLLQFFKRRGVEVLGIDPAAGVAAAARRDHAIETVVRFFGRSVATELRAQGRTADLVVANNVLAHVPDINDFVAGFPLLLAPKGIATFEFPHLLRLIEGCQFDTIYHEHYSYLSLLAVEQILAAHGLAVFDVEELPTHGGSLRVFACHAGHDVAPSPRVAALRAAERAFGLHEPATYAAFAERVRRAKRRLLRFLIDAKEEGRTICGYGAPAKGNTLLNFCGIGTDFLDFTVDRSSHKQGRLLPGSGILVLAPEEIERQRPDYVLLLPWNLEEEIVAQMAVVRSWGGRFVVPIPEVRVVP